MEIIKSKELAFFNMLGKLITLNTKENHENVTLSYSDLQKKMELDKILISSFLEKLKDDKIIEIIKNDETSVSINFVKTHEKLLEFISPGDLDSVISEINEFIFKYINLFNFDQTYNTIVETAKKMKSALDKNPKSDLSSFIREGIQELYSHPLVAFYYSKFFFELAEKIDKEDQKTLENIIYYFFNLPYEENPFITTTFLAQVSFQIEALKSGVKWNKLS
ncbi:MAG: hypothetical protein ACRC0G_17825, partial [Fusobacteriaceae bacterium]